MIDRGGVNGINHDKALKKSDDDTCSGKDIGGILANACKTRGKRETKGM